MQICMMEIGRGSNRKDTSEINRNCLFISLVLNGLDLMKPTNTSSVSVLSEAAVAAKIDKWVNRLKSEAGANTVFVVHIAAVPVGIAAFADAHVHGGASIARRR